MNNRLAQDALAADFELAIDERMRYDALQEGLMGNYQDDRDNPFTNAARGRDACGINLDEVSDSDATGYVPQRDAEELVTSSRNEPLTIRPGAAFEVRVGATPTSRDGLQRLENWPSAELRTEPPALILSKHGAAQLLKHLNTITKFLANMPRSKTDASGHDDAIDAAYEIDQILRNK